MAARRPVHTFKATGDETGDAYTLFQLRGPGGLATPMHRHENEEEGFYIVDGQVTIFADSAENQLGPGGFAFVPRGTTHAFRLDSTQATLLLLISPGNAGHESMFREMGEPAAQPELPAPPRRSIRGPWPRSPSDTGRSSSGRRLCPDLAPSRVRRDSPGFWSTIRTTVIWGGPDYAGSVERINGDVARRVRSQHLNHDDGLITMALATRGTNFCKDDVVRYEWELPKELGINITVHVAMDRFGYTKMQLRRLKEMDLLYPNTTYIHSSHLLDDEWQMVVDSGGNVSLAPQIELQMGHGWAPAAPAAKMGIPVPVVGRGDHRAVRSVHADARHLRFGAGAPSPGRVGRGSRRQRADHSATGWRGTQWRWLQSADMLM